MRSQTTSAPTGDRQITIALPSEIPVPKFQLFQSVEVEDNSTGVIVGLQYVTLFAAIAEQSGNYGWNYTVNFYFGDDLTPLTKALPYGATSEFWESDLEAVEEA